MSTPDLALPELVLLIIPLLLLPISCLARTKKARHDSMIHAFRHQTESLETASVMNVMIPDGEERKRKVADGSPFDVGSCGSWRAPPGLYLPRLNHDCFALLLRLVVCLSSKFFMIDKTL